MPFEPFIKSTVSTVEHLFAGSYRFQLPWLQRAYAWNELHVGRLIDDVYRASLEPRQRYSLGRIVIAKAGETPECSLIDGHQRSITLTILFALLRDLLPGDPVAERLHGLIEAPGGGLHLTPQPSVAPFCAAYVQQFGRTLVDPEGDIFELTESERNILSNRTHMRSKIEKLMPHAGERARFAAFLLRRCYAFVEIVEDEDEAWSLLSIEEETGLDLHSSELAKLSLVRDMPRGEQEAAGRFYEQAQAIVGADDMSKLLCHIRTLEVRKRTSRPVENDLKARFKLDQSGLAFLERQLLPRAESMVLLNRRAIGTGAAREATAASLTTLFWLDHQFWMPASLHWLDVMGASHDETPRFFARLDRLAYLMKIAGVDPTDQERRFVSLLGDIDRKLPVDAMPQLLIEPDLRSDALAHLRSSTFYSKRMHGLVLRRISWNLAPERDPGPVDGRHVTVEHVLPRKPPKSRRWWTDFKSQQNITRYCNRIGNLTFLSNTDNRQADTLDFAVKREILLAAAPAFVLAEHAARETVWTEDVIDARSADMIAILMAPWDA